MKITGKVLRIDAAEEKNNFKSRTITIDSEPDSEYGSIVELQFQGEKCSLLDGVKVGDMVECDYRFSGREWMNDAKGKMVTFNTVKSWSIKVVGTTTTPATAATAPATPDAPMPF